MIKWILALVLLSSELFALQIFPYRSKLDSAWKNEVYNERFIKCLESKGLKKEQGYLAVAYIMKSNHASMPWTKLKYFHKGKNLLEQTIKENPNVVEWIFYRHEIQRRIPKGLNYNNLKEDLETLKNFVAVKENKHEDESLYSYILKLLKCT